MDLIALTGGFTEILLAGIDLKCNSLTRFMGSNWAPYCCFCYTLYHTVNNSSSREVFTAKPAVPVYCCHSAFDASNSDRLIKLILATQNALMLKKGSTQTISKKTLPPLLRPPVHLPLPSHLFPLLSNTICSPLLSFHTSSPLFWHLISTTLTSCLLPAHLRFSLLPISPPRYHLFMKYGSVAIVTGLKYHQGYNILKMTLASRLHYRVKSFIVNFVWNVAKHKKTE